jgi:hypothetical protein
MKNLSKLAEKAQKALSSSSALIISPVSKETGDIIKDLNGGWKQIHLKQSVQNRTNVGGAMLTNKNSRNCFYNISPDDFALFGDYIEEGEDFNAILKAIGETPKQITWQKSTDPFFETQQNVKYEILNKKGKSFKPAKYEDAMTADGEPYYRNGILTEFGEANIWGSNDINEDTNYPEFKAFEKAEVEAMEMAEAENDPA